MAKPYPKKGVRKPVKSILKTVEQECEQQSLLSLFVGIWQSREPGSKFVAREYESAEEWFNHTSKYRVCAITYQSLYYFDVWNFMHVLTRNYTKLRESEKNIVLGTRAVHTEYDGGARSKLLLMGPGAKWLLEYREKLKSEYHK